MRGVRRFLGSTLAALAVALLCTAAAGASTYCVAEPACPAGGVKESADANGVGAALEQAQSHTNVGGPDTVLIGPGSFSRSANFSYSGEPVLIKGAGAGLTTLSIDGKSATTAFVLNGSPGTVLSGIRIVVPPVKAIQGLLLQGGTAEGVTIESPLLATNSANVKIEGNAVFSHGTISDLNGTAVVMEGGEVLDSTIYGGNYGVEASQHGTLRGDEISGGTPLVSYFSNPLVIEDTLFDCGGTSNAGLELNANINGATNVTMRHIAIVNGHHIGIILNGTEKTATATLTDSVILGAEESLNVSGTAATNTTTEYSSYDATKDFVSAPGAVHPEHPLAAAPLSDFLSPLTGDFRLAPGSPLIDAGAPGASVAPGEFATDLAGNPRIVHGVSDVGPYEYQWRPPVVSVVPVTATQPARGLITFSGSATTPEAGDAIKSYQWTFDDGAVVPAGSTASHAFLTGGIHMATLTATDTAGARGSASIQVKVAQEVCAVKCGGCGTVAKCPAHSSGLFGFALSPRSFHAARGGTSFGKAHTGAKVAYTLRGAAARVTFTVISRVAGVTSGKSCLAAGSGRHGKRCTRLVRLHGSFAKQSRAGGNSFRFTGRLAGRTLGRGSYLLVASARIGGRTFSVRAPFSISG